MTVSEKFKLWLNEYFNWEEANIPNLDRPILLIIDYSPTDGAQPFSFAFEPGENKCWITHDKIRIINNQAPSFNEGYRKFVYGERCFYPYSIQIPSGTFDNIQEFKNTCEKLYNHIDQE